MNKRFIVECSMDPEYIPAFVSFLKTLEANGELGESGWTSFYSDGTTNFRPHFSFTGQVTRAKCRGTLPGFNLTMPQRIPITNPDGSSGISYAFAYHEPHTEESSEESSEE